MNANTPIPRRRLARRLPLVLLALLALGATAAPVRADACSSCPSPTTEQLAAQPDFPRGDWPSGTYLESLACECTYSLSGTPNVTQGPAWLALRGAGEVWSCPESSSEDSVTIEIAETDSTSWSITTEASASLSAPAVSFALKIASSNGGAHGITEVKRVTKVIRAAMGHRIPWSGYFELADFTMDMDLAVTRRWSWWVKNVWTGHVVLASGSIYQDCGTEHAALSRRASIGYRFRLSDAPCDGSLPPHDMGFFPQLPPPPPNTTPGEEEPAPSAPSTVVFGDPDDEEDEPADRPPASSEDLGDAPTGPIDEPQGDPSATEPGSGS